MSKNITELDKKSFDSFVKQGMVVVDFWAPWCGPCKIMGPVLDKTADELKDKAKFGKVNVDDNVELAQRFNIMSIPTLMFFRDGKQVDRAVGVVSKDSIEKKIKGSR